MIEIFPTPDRLADAVARHLVARAADAISTSGRFTLALSGGSTPRAAYELLATDEFARRVEWGRVHVLWGDERCVPPADPRSNYRMAKEALLDWVPIPPDHIHRIRGEDNPEKAAADYERVLRALFEACHPERSDNHCHPERSEGAGTPLPVNTSRSGSFASLRMTNLDLVLLGLGEDGHTASLFPGQSAVHETTRWVMAVPAPDGKLWRITLTPMILNAAHNVTFVVSGASKAARLAQVLEGPFTPDLLPAQAIRPGQGRLTWMVDEAGAGELRVQRTST